MNGWVNELNEWMGEGIEWMDGKINMNGWLKEWIERTVGE